MCRNSDPKLHFIIHKVQTPEGREINNFGITNTIQNIMRENQKRKKTRKESQRQEDEDKIIYREEKGMSND